VVDSSCTSGATTNHMVAVAEGTSSRLGKEKEKEMESFSCDLIL